MAKERTYKTLDESEEEYYRNHPDEIDGYLTTAFEEYAKDGCTAALFTQLRIIARVKGVSALLKKQELHATAYKKHYRKMGVQNLKVLMQL